MQEPGLLQETNRKP